MRRQARVAALMALCIAAPAIGQRPDPATGEAAFRALFKEMVETDTSVATGNCTILAEKVSARMQAAGFPAENLHLFVPDGHPKAGGLVAVYPGTDPQAKAVLMLGHIDVVNADRADWARDPFVLIEENGQFYGRGVSDMKAQDAIWADTMVRFHQEGYRPRRTVKMALTCGEEGGFLNGARWLAQNRRDLIDAGFALTEGGGGDLDDNGRKLAVTVMDQEKAITGLTLEVTNPGGHSSRPRRDNAIYTMAHALERLEQLEFAPQFNKSNRPYFLGMADLVGGENGQAMKALLANVDDRQAYAVLSRTPAYRAMLGTTCIPTLISGGHASNAQPQRVSAMINCRMLPETSAAEVRAAILDVVGALVLAEGISGLTFDRVARLAGVSRTTLHAWWPSRGALALDGYAHAVHEALSFPDTGDLRADLRTQVHGFAAVMAGPGGRALLEIIGAAQTDPDLAAAHRQLYSARRRELACARLDRARAAGQVRADVDPQVVIDQLWGAVYHRLLIPDEPVTPEFLDALVDNVLHGIGP